MLLLWARIFLIKQINISYIDYGEGSYLYEAWRITSGKTLYKDFFAPQPPILYVIGAILIRLKHSVIFIRSFFLFLYIITNILSFQFIEKVFQDEKLALAVSISSFFLPISTKWWRTFTAEPIQRFLLLIILLQVLPFKTLSHKRIHLIAFLSVILILTKYTAIITVFFIFLFLFFIDKRKFFYLLVYFFILSFFCFLTLQSLTSQQFVSNTILIRKNISIKTLDEIFFGLFLFLSGNIFFLITNLFLGLYLFIKKKEYNISFLLFLPIFYCFNLFFTLYNGTYNYIFYPVEPFYVIGFFFILFSLVKKNLNKVIPNSTPFKIILVIFSFLSSLSWIYSVTPYKTQWRNSSDGMDIYTTKKIINFIEKHSNLDDEIIAPPFFAFATLRRTPEDFYDPFMWRQIYINKKTQDINLVERSLGKIKNKINKRKIPIIITDWRIRYFDVFSDKELEKYYKKIDQLRFLNNETGVLAIYVRK